MRAWIVLLVVVSFAGAALADERAAQHHFERGEKLYTLKKYAAALEEYQQAFDASPIPDFLFNIGQCYRNLGQYDDAVFTYKRFLKLEPDAPNREKVEHLITDLEAKLAAQGDGDKFKLQPKPREPEVIAPAPAPTPGPVETPAPPIYKKWWFWTGVAVVGAGAGVGIYALTRASGPGTDYSVVWPK